MFQKEKERGNYNIHDLFKNDYEIGIIEEMSPTDNKMNFFCKVRKEFIDIYKKNSLQLFSRRRGYLWIYFKSVLELRI